MATGANYNLIGPWAAVAGAVFGAGTTVTGPSDGTLQVTTSAGAFGALLLGAAGATTGVKVGASNGTLVVTKGDGSSGAQLQVANGSAIFGVFNTSGTYVGVNGLYGGGGSGSMGSVQFPATNTGAVAFAKATGTLAGAAFTFDGPVQVQGGAWILSGTGVPASGLGVQGSIFLRTDGAAGSTFYVKTGTSTWTAVG